MLSTLWQAIKNNPWKFFLGSSSTVFLTLVGMWFSDVRYVHTKDIESYVAATNATISNLTDEVNALMNSPK